MLRDELYNGNARMEKCAVVIREAENFLRFGSFEGNQISLRKMLLDYLLKYHFEFLAKKQGDKTKTVDQKDNGIK